MLEKQARRKKITLKGQLDALCDDCKPLGPTEGNMLNTYGTFI